MLHRKWRSTKQQPSRARSGNQISCCLVSLHFPCNILSMVPVTLLFWWLVVRRAGAAIINERSLVQETLSLSLGDHCSSRYFTYFLSPLKVCVRSEWPRIFSIPNKNIPRLDTSWVLISHIETLSWLDNIGTESTTEGIGGIPIPHSRHKPQALRIGQFLSS